MLDDMFYILVKIKTHSIFLIPTLWLVGNLLTFFQVGDHRGSVSHDHGAHLPKFLYTYSYRVADMYLGCFIS